MSTTPMLDRWIQLCTDGAVQVDSRTTAAEGILRHGNGEWIIGYNRFLCECFLDGLALIQDRQYAGVMIQMDNIEDFKFYNTFFERLIKLLIALPMVFDTRKGLKVFMEIPKEDLISSSNAKAKTWLGFRYVDNLIMKGGGTLDGQGQSAWPFNQCHKNNNCQALPISVKFDFVTNSRIKSIRSIHSKNAHFSFFGCTNINISNVELLAPDYSPNTDGIKMGSSSNIRISYSKISTGDDCIAILSDSSNIDISNVYGGPGHGISIGSLGKYTNEKNVNGVSVRKCTLNGTDNGIRIKSWESPISITASNFLFQDIFMYNVRNPIIIDQTYCPHPPCNRQTASHVQIRDVTYRNIFGTSSSEIAVSMQCSKKFPCKNIVMTDIKFGHHGIKKSLKSYCSYVNGRSFGRQYPPPCF
ncbi:exopolygalacturonase [Gossypium hirsutum]|uniref:Exopolygalacturonase n=1 Tax=Gossypium hirsutum TaxID=3635 RepID=A0ABM2ZN80_GOSHI|nr:exopolygalacturonase-like [Gossypium hirsutum]